MCVICNSVPHYALYHKDTRKRALHRDEEKRKNLLKINRIFIIIHWTSGDDMLYTLY
jgi:hypothetical protein